MITGGAGFIGCHTVKHFAAKGHEIVMVDNLSRRGSSRNLEWVRRFSSVKHYATDVRDYEAMKEIFVHEGPFKAVIHLAAQVGVVTSIKRPLEDFEINARGTLYLLECMRAYSPHALFIFSSTNKVYGALWDVSIREEACCYRMAHPEEGIGEDRCMDFHSPYGCSKGCADQYVVDYARIYDLRTVTFRQSCIYGERQFGVEDQGWVAWLAIAAVLGIRATLYGDGKQVRDLLHVNDLVEVYSLTLEQRNECKGRIYNIGGGVANSLSLLELIEMLREHGLQMEYQFADARPGDQRVFISDNRKALTELGWQPKMPVGEGITRLVDWIKRNRDMLQAELIGEVRSLGQ